jgi:hypothetical protein
MRGVSIVGLAFLALTLATACGGDDGESPRETPTATTQATVAGTPTGTTSADIPRTPVPTQSAESSGRTDCPDGWLAYRNEAFSICYPREHYAHLWLPPTDDVFHLAVRLIAGEPITQTPDVLDVSSSQTYDPPVECKHVSEYITEPDSAVIEPYSVGPLSGMSCTALLGAGGQFRGALETPAGAIVFDANATSIDKLNLVKQILGTLVVEAKS